MSSDDRLLSMPLTDSNLSLPHALGPYQLEVELGRGGMGVVYEAYDQRLDRRVAVKRLLPGQDDGEDGERRARLLREAQTTARLDHPAIVQVFDLIDDNDGLWIVMERLHGQSLSALLDEGPLDVETTLRFARQMTQGLAAAHALGIVHRDLKTENVMVLRDGRIKILDFGIAKSVRVEGEDPRWQDLSKTGAIVGTGRAMSPEQARGLSLGPRSDLFSLGILLYECLAGVSPFRGKSAIDTLARIISHHPQPIEELVPAVPQGLAELITRLLRKAPELRPASALEVERTLDGLIEPSRSTHPQEPVMGDEPTVMASGAVPRLTDEQSRAGTLSAVEVLRLPGRGKAWVAAVALVAFATILAWTLTQAPGTQAPGAQEPGTQRSSNAAGQTVAAMASAPAQSYDEAMQSLRWLDDPGIPDRAITTFRQMIELDPESASAHAGLARAYWERARSASAGGDPVFMEQALAMAEEAVDLNGYLADARVSLGLVLTSQGRYDEAAEHLDFALDLVPTHADAHYGLGRLAESNKRFDTAEHYYAQAGESQPSPIYFNALGALLYDRSRYESAELAFLQALELAPGDLYSLRNLGALYYAQGRLDDAAGKLQDALKIRPDASLFSNLGTVLFSRGLYSQALAAFEEALAMDGAANRFIFWINLADAARQVPGRSADAERSYRRGIQMLDDLLESRPDDTRLRSRRGLALARAGDFQKAREDLDFVRSVGTGGDLYSLFRLAIAEELIGERQKALDALSETLRSGFSLSEVRYEPDLVKLRADPRFHHLLAGLEGGS